MKWEKTGYRDTQWQRAFAYVPTHVTATKVVWLEDYEWRRDKYGTTEYREIGGTEVFRGFAID